MTLRRRVEAIERSVPPKPPSTEPTYEVLDPLLFAAAMTELYVADRTLPILHLRQAGATDEGIVALLARLLDVPVTSVQEAIEEADRDPDSDDVEAIGHEDVVVVDVA
jgi:hypothetical protein